MSKSQLTGDKTCALQGCVHIYFGELNYWVLHSEQGLNAITRASWTPHLGTVATGAPQTSSGRGSLFTRGPGAPGEAAKLSAPGCQGL